MSTSDKPDPARGWKFVERRLAEDLERFDQASDDEVERQMNAAKVVVSARVPGAEDLLAKAAERGATKDAGAAGGRAATGMWELSPGRRTVARRVWLVAAALGALGLVVFVLRRPSGESQGTPAPGQVVAQLRQKALHECEVGDWQRCLKELDEARAQDPEGERTPAVREARERAERGLRAVPAPEAAPDGKP